MKYIQILFLCFLIISCGENTNLEDTAYNPTPYIVEVPKGFPPMPIPADNPLTLEGITLGRDLFYDKKLSGNNTMSCSSCHDPHKGFTDGKATSKGIDGINGKRSSMSLVNVGFIKNGMFWDGRAKSLEDQALRPVEDKIELHTTWPEVEVKLQKDANYPTLFRKAFGIKDKAEITKDLAVKAIAQFERIIVSGGNSRYDKFIRGELKFTDEELMGYILYSDGNKNLSTDFQCNHCHQLDLAEGDAYFNNGLQATANLEGFNDLGKGGFTKKLAENGTMRAVTLRNIMLSAPYMHNGSLSTMDEVMEHYMSGGKASPNKDPLISQIKKNNFTQQNKKALIAFLHTLTDTSYLSNPLIYKK